MRVTAIQKTDQQTGISYFFHGLGAPGLSALRRCRCHGQ
jgi:hypothetical protein